MKPFLFLNKKKALLKEAQVYLGSHFDELSLKQRVYLAKKLAVSVSELEELWKS